MDMRLLGEIKPLDKLAAAFETDLIWHGRMSYWNLHVYPIGSMQSPEFHNLNVSWQVQVDSRSLLQLETILNY